MKLMTPVSAFFLSCFFFLELVTNHVPSYEKYSRSREKEESFEKNGHKIEAKKKINKIISLK